MVQAISVKQNRDRSMTRNAMRRPLAFASHLAFRR
jgi:hypothetical protein